VGGHLGKALDFCPGSVPNKARKPAKNGNQRTGGNRMSNLDDTASDQTMIARLPGRSLVWEEVGHFVTYIDGKTARMVRRRIGPAGLVIGRTAPADVELPLPDISRRHCRIDIQGDWGVLSDLGSTNGTFVENSRLSQPVRLMNGSGFLAGSFPLRYERRPLSEVAGEEALSEELRLAEDYVRAILPPPLERGAVLAEWCFVPSSQLGGDAFGYQYLDEEIFCGFVLDVSGHGIGSAMHAANVANALRRKSLPEVDFRDPGQVAARLNEVFPMEEHNGLMLTMWYFTYHIGTRVLRYCAAGHHASLLVVPGYPNPTPLWVRSPAIGMLPSAKWSVGKQIIPAGGRLFVFSDGAFEILTPDNQQLTLDDFTGVIAQPPQAGVAEPERIYQTIRMAARPGPLDDDVSVLMFTFM